jgi:hypothetical protein
VAEPRLAPLVQLVKFALKEYLPLAQENYMATLFSKSLYIFLGLVMLFIALRAIMEMLVTLALPA